MLGDMLLYIKKNSFSILVHPIKENIPFHNLDIETFTTTMLAL